MLIEGYWALFLTVLCHVCRTIKLSFLARWIMTITEKEKNPYNLGVTKCIRQLLLLRREVTSFASSFWTRGVGFMTCQGMTVICVYNSRQDREWGNHWIGSLIFIPSSYGVLHLLRKGCYLGKGEGGKLMPLGHTVYPGVDYVGDIKMNPMHETINDRCFCCEKLLHFACWRSAYSFGGKWSSADSYFRLNLQFRRIVRILTRL